MTVRRTLARAVAAGALAAGLMASVGAPAQAYTETMYWTGGTYAACKKWQNSMISSWTKVGKSCHRNGNGWAFTIISR